MTKPPPPLAPALFHASGVPLRPDEALHAPFESLAQWQAKRVEAVPQEACSDAEMRNAGDPAAPGGDEEASPARQLQELLVKRLADDMCASNKQDVCALVCFNGVRWWVVGGTVAG